MSDADRILAPGRKSEDIDAALRPKRLDEFGKRDYNVNMAQVSVSLPAELQRYVDARAAAEGYSSADDFLRDLIQRDREGYRAEVARVRALIEEGIASGVVDAEPEAVLDEIIAGLSTRHG